METVQGAAFVQSYRSAEAEHSKRKGVANEPPLPFDPRRGDVHGLSYPCFHAAVGVALAGPLAATHHAVGSALGGYWLPQAQGSLCVDSASSGWPGATLYWPIDVMGLSQAIRREAPRRRMRRRGGSFAVRRSTSPGQTG